ncbi:MAG: hypothetical protein JWP45_2116 [Mucilaginibacter sp.]|nr:hypothetical protein [Mucilaginibacter sp.]
MHLFYLEMSFYEKTYRFLNPKCDILNKKTICCQIFNEEAAITEII